MVSLLLPMDRHRKHTRWFFALLIGIIALGCLIRMSLVTATDFPLNDGGMFYQMTEDLIASHFQLPHTTSYNHMGIPFVYPPLSFYLMGIMHIVSAYPIISLVHYLPALFYCGALIAYAILCLQLVRSRVVILVAVLFYCFEFRPMLWHVYGGGTTRSLGLVLAICSLIGIHKSVYIKGIRWQIISTVCITGTMLSHPNVFLFVISSILCFMMLGINWKQSLRVIIRIGISTVILSSIWWLPILSHWGASPFIHAASTNGSDNLMYRFAVFSRVGLSPILLLLFCVGFLASIMQKRLWGVAIWMIITTLLFYFYITALFIPLGIIIGIGCVTCIRILELCFPYFRRSWHKYILSAGFVVFIAILEFGNMNEYHRIRSAIVSRTITTVLPAEDRKAMAWIAEHTPVNASFLLINTINTPWAINTAHEWFPVLTGRQSITTPQGLEWVSKFSSVVERYNHVAVCASRNTPIACIESHMTTHRAPLFEYVYLSFANPLKWNSRLGQIERIENELAKSFEMIYFQPTVSVWKRKQ